MDVFMSSEDTMPLIKSLYYLLILCIFFSNDMAFAKSTAFNECKLPLTLSSTTDWYPYIFKDKQGNSSGIDVSLLTQILDEMQCQLAVVQFPERRSLFELNQGHMDIGLGASKNNARVERFNYSTTYRLEINKFIYRYQDRKITNASSLNDLLKTKVKIAINLAGWYGNEIEMAKIDHNNFVYSDTVKRRLKMLNFDRVDIVIDDEVVLCSELLRTRYSGLSIHPMELYKTDIHFIFNKKSISKNFVNQFNKILNKMRDDGRLFAHFSQLLSPQCTLSVNKVGEK